MSLYASILIAPSKYSDQLLLAQIFTLVWRKDSNISLMLQCFQPGLTVQIGSC
jgi:hypothetical protein